MHNFLEHKVRLCFFYKILIKILLISKKILKLYEKYWIFIKNSTILLILGLDHLYIRKLCSCQAMFYLSFLNLLSSGKPRCSGKFRAITGAAEVQHAFVLRGSLEMLGTLKIFKLENLRWWWPQWLPASRAFPQCRCHCHPLSKILI